MKFYNRINALKLFDKLGWYQLLEILRLSSCPKKNITIGENAFVPPTTILLFNICKVLFGENNLQVLLGNFFKDRIVTIRMKLFHLDQQQIDISFFH